MAGVDHGYQYSVEVKSRFSLFLDDSLNSEDPDLLLSKLQNRRAEKNKKEKQNSARPPEPVKPVAASKEEIKPEPQLKTKVVRVSRQAKPSEAEENGVDGSVGETIEVQPEPQTYWRGAGGRGLSGRGFRGSRGSGLRPSPTEYPQELPNNLNAEDTPFEPRGRGRGRGFSRGRGRGPPYRDFREFDRGVMRRGRGGNGSGPRTASEEDTHTLVVESGDTVLPDSEGAEVNTERGVQEGGPTTPEVVEEKPKTYTLQEYKAMMSSVKPAVVLSSKEGRKANDGKDVFANMVAHRKQNEISDDEVEEVEEEPEERQSFDFDVSYTDRLGERGRGFRGYNGRGFDRGRGPNFRGRPRGERGMRGGRGAFRGEARGRGFGRGVSTEQYVSPPAIYSDQDFPSLK